VDFPSSRYALVPKGIDWPYLEQFCEGECDGPENDDGQRGVDTAYEVVGLGLEGALVEKQDGDLDAGDGGNIEKLDHICNLGMGSSAFGTLDDVAKVNRDGMSL
jgi:hypothetical protein